MFTFYVCGNVYEAALHTLTTNAGRVIQSSSSVKVRGKYR